MTHLLSIINFFIMFNTFYPKMADAPLPESYFPAQMKTLLVTDESGRLVQRAVASVVTDDPNSGLEYQDFGLETLDFASLTALKGKTPLPPLQRDSLSVASSIMSIPQSAWLALSQRSAAPAAPAAPPAAPAAPAPDSQN